MNPRITVTVAIVLCALGTSQSMAEEKKSGPRGNASSYDHVDPSYGKVFGNDGAEVKGMGNLLKVNHASDKQLEAYEKWFTENEERHLKEVADLVAFPTLAMDPEGGEDLVKAAEYLKKKLVVIMKDGKIYKNTL